MTYILALSKSGSNVLTETNINNFIFHSNYNTFKIISSGTVSFNMSGNESGQRSVAHNLNYIPLVSAFCKINTQEGALTAIGSFHYFDDILTMRFLFSYLRVNQNNIVFSFTNYDSNSITVYVRFYLYEVPL